MGGVLCKTVKPLKAILFSALLFSFLLLSTTFISCAGGAGSPASGGSAEATSLCIQLPASVEVPAKYLARTAQYAKVDSNFETFTVSITSSSYKSTKSCGRGEKLTFSNIPVGHYDVVALAKKADGAVTAKGTTTVDVEPDVTKTVRISLTRLDYHTVQFLNEDGSTISSQDVSDGYTATKPANPAPSAGKLFSFWTADATVGDSSTPFDFNTPITGDTTLKPVFGVITYTVKYVSPVGSFTASDFTAATASSYSLPSTSSVTGLTFAGWYADAAFSTTVDAASVRDVTTFTKKDDLHYEKSIYAKWTAVVTFDPRNGGSATTSDPLVYNVDTAASSKPADPTKTGATFLGWYTGTVSGSGATATVTYASTAYSFTTKVTSNITLYAKWDSREITYVSDIALGTDYTAAIGAYKYYPASGWTAAQMPAPTHTGLTFAGWYKTRSEDGKTYSDKVTSVAANSGELTLYAKWTAKVTFDSMGGSAVTAQDVIYNKTATAPTAPTKTGLTLAGWYTSTDGGTTLSETAFDFDDEITENITLYAKWGLGVGGLSDYLESLPAGSAEEPNVLPAITGLTASNWTNIKTALTANSTKYVDLSATALPAGITTMEEGFKNCTNLVVAPAIPDTVTDMDGCFRGCSSLTAAPTIPDSVTDMGNCFSECRSLTAAPAIPDGVTSMFRCFYSCSSLTAAPAIPDSVTDMASCFSGCSSLTAAPVIPDSVTDMGNCFNSCSSLTAAPAIPDSVTNMASCFRYCYRLTAAPVIPDSVTDMSSCFSECSSLTAAPTIPDSVTNMYGCFYKCRSLTTAPVIPDSVQSMTLCFSGCTSLTGEIVINAVITNSSKWNYAFDGIPSSVTIKVKNTDVKDAIVAAINSNPTMSDYNPPSDTQIAVME